MASKSFNLYTAFGLLLIISTTFLGAYFIFSQQNIGAAALLILLVLAEMMFFVTLLNKTNKKIATFFNAVHNQDTTLLLPKKSGNKAIKEIYDGMNKVVRLFQSIKMESEFKEKLFMAMIEHSTTGFISIDQYGDFEIMNQMARNLLGVEYTSNMKRMKTNTPELFQLLLDLKPGQSKSCKIAKNDFYTTIQVSSSKLNYKDKQLTLVSLLDIQNEIDASEMESWQKLIRIMNHEIMNSIAPITSATKSLMKIFVKNDKPLNCKDLSEREITDTINCLEIIDSMSSGLTNFVGNYQKMRKIPEPILKPIDIQKWGQTLKHVLQECVEGTDCLEVVVNEKLTSFVGDESLLTQVLINLVKNASHAPKTDNEKRIVLKIEPSHINKVTIKVWNNGQVIDNEVVDKIFVPFYTTKSNGAGIGLYVSKQIVNQHGGSLGVKSNSDSGTTFTILI